MKKVLQGAILPFAIFTSGILLIGCEQDRDINTIEKADDIETSQENSKGPTNQGELKSGNMFYIVRDVADMQLKTNDYIDQLKVIQSNLEKAVNQQDQQELQASAKQLQTQLIGLNEALNALNLKSQEINNIRSNILSANDKVLASPFLNGDIDLSKVDFKKIQQQMGSVQTEMIKLAAMMLSPEQEKSS